MVHWITERMDILHPGQNSVHTDLRGYFRKDAASWVNWADTTTTVLSEQEKADIEYLATDNNDWTTRVAEPRKRWLYKTPAFLYEVNTPDFKLRVNPLLNGQVGFESNRDEMLYINTRGFEVRGSIDDRVFFHSNLEETQLRYPDYVDCTSANTSCREPVLQKTTPATRSDWLRGTISTLPMRIWE
jgi:hypothetical protein